MIYTLNDINVEIVQDKFIALTL